MTTTGPSRSSDPDTSAEAAEKAAVRAPIIRDTVLSIVREKGPLTHDELIREYHERIILDPDTPRASDSGIRTRLSELRRQRLVAEDIEDGVSLYGNRAKRWIAVDPDAPVELPADEDAIARDLPYDDADNAGTTSTAGVAADEEKSAA